MCTCATFSLSIPLLMGVDTDSIFFFGTVNREAAYKQGSLRNSFAINTHLLKESCEEKPKSMGIPFSFSTIVTLSSQILS